MSQCIYVSLHVRFHEDVFPFTNSEQIAQQPFTSSQQTHLPTLGPSLNFHPTSPPIHQTSSSNRPPTSPLLIHHSPTMSATIPSPPSPSITICFFSNDHYAGTSYHSLELYASSSATVEKPGSDIDSSLYVAAQFGISTSSPADLQLYVDLSSYPLQQLTGSGSSPPRSIARQHPMILHSRLPKTTLLAAFAATSVASIYRVVSPPTYEPIVFSDAHRYEAWHAAMREEIQALRFNNTWSLVPFHPSMNVVGGRWVYKIKHRVDGNIERYKARLIARGFTQQKGIDYSEISSPIIKQTTVKLAFSIVVSRN